jgi:hypothetical protein
MSDPMHGTVLGNAPVEGTADTGRQKELPRSTNLAAELASTADRAWFDTHPGENELLRELFPGEFDYPGSLPLPVPPPGYRHAVHVSATYRDPSGAALGRYRQLVALRAQPNKNGDCEMDDDDEGLIKINTNLATVADLFAHAAYLLKKGDAKERARMMEAAKVAEERAGVDRTKRLRDVSDQHGLN